MSKRPPRSATPVDKTIGRNIRARREKLSMSQEKLADAIGVTFQQLQKYETAANRVAASRLFLIAKALDEPVGKFFVD